MKSFWVYMLRCSDDSYYIGHTDDLEKRIAEHDAALVESYTSQRLPVELIWCEEFVARQEALERERQIKGWSRAKKGALAEGDWEKIRQLAKSRPSTGSGRTGK